MLRLAGEEVVDADDRPALLQQAFGEVRPEKIRRRQRSTRDFQGAWMTHPLRCIKGMQRLPTPRRPRFLQIIVKTNPGVAVPALD
jgi:hypothetical protein